MRVCIHRGTHEIGGTCVEIESQGKRIVLDVGLPLDAEPADVPLPAVPGFDRPDSSLLGVIISHPHMDHYGLAHKLPSGTPILIGQAAQRILEAASVFVPGEVRMDNTTPLQDGKPIPLDPFTITPFLVDHSAYDAYALLVEADGQRLFYSGDIRGHGRKSKLFERLVSQPPKSINCLLMEGTTIGRAGLDDQYPTETDLERQFEELFRKTIGLSLVWCSGQNIDRLVTIYRAARHVKKQLIVDMYTASVLREIGNPKLPQPGFEGFRVFLPWSQKQTIIRGKLFSFAKSFHSARIYPENLAGEAARSVMLFRPSMIKDLEKAKCLKDAQMIYSLWGGYLKQDRQRRFLDWLEQNGIPMEHCHTSGHAPLADLQRLAKALAPEVLVPIHSFETHKFGALFENVVLAQDGCAFELSAAIHIRRGSQVPEDWKTLTSKANVTDWPPSLAQRAKDICQEVQDIADGEVEVVPWPKSYSFKRRGGNGKILGKLAMGDGPVPAIAIGFSDTVEGAKDLAAEISEAVDPRTFAGQRFHMFADTGVETKRIAEVIVKFVRQRGLCQEPKLEGVKLHTSLPNNPTGQPSKMGTTAWLKEKYKRVGLDLRDTEQSISSHVIRVPVSRLVAVGWDCKPTEQVYAFVDALHWRRFIAQEKQKLTFCIYTGDSKDGVVLDAISTLFFSLPQQEQDTVSILQNDQPARLRVPLFSGHNEKWAEDLVRREANALPRLAVELKAKAAVPAFRWYRNVTQNLFSGRVEGLEVCRAQPDEQQITFEIGSPGKNGNESKARKRFRELTGQSEIAFGPMQLEEAVDLLRRLGSDRATGILQHVEREHLLESRILRGVETGLMPIEAVVPPDDCPFQFPALWSTDDRPRFIDVVGQIKDIPWVVELKADGAGGQGQYYRHGIPQAVLYRHFIRSAHDLHFWYVNYGLDPHKCEAAVAFPVLRGRDPDPAKLRKEHQDIADLFGVRVIELPV
jgi:ribonuclease J